MNAIRSAGVATRPDQRGAGGHDRVWPLAEELDGREVGGRQRLPSRRAVEVLVLQRNPRGSVNAPPVASAAHAPSGARSDRPSQWQAFSWAMSLQGEPVRATTGVSASLALSEESRTSRSSGR